MYVFKKNPSSAILKSILITIFSISAPQLFSFGGGAPKPPTEDPKPPTTPPEEDPNPPSTPPREDPNPPTTPPNDELVVTGFALYDESTQKDISGYTNLKDGQLIDLTKIKNKNLNIRVKVSGKTIGSVFMQSPLLSKGRFEKQSPYTIFNEKENSRVKFRNSTYEFEATPYSGSSNGTGTRGKYKSISLKFKTDENSVEPPTPPREEEPAPAPTPTPAPPSNELAVTGFALYDESTKKDISGYTNLKDGQLIDLTKIKNKDLNIRVKVSGKTVGNVFMQSSLLSKGRYEKKSPYTIFNEKENTRPNFRSTTYEFEATPYSGSSNGTGIRGKYKSISLKFKTDEPAIEPPAPPSSKSKNVSKTIVITKSGTYDYKNVLHKWTGSGSCNQKENQPPILRISASNVIIKNFRWQGAPDGIHVHCNTQSQGNKCTKKISNVKLINLDGHACEDLLTTGRNVSNVQILGGVFKENPNKKHVDKTFQLNFGTNLLIDGAKFIGGLRCIRTKSGVSLTVRNTTFDGCEVPFKGDTGVDVLKEIKPHKIANILSENNTFKNCKQRAFDRNDDKVRYKSRGDKFQNCDKGEVTDIR